MRKIQLCMDIFLFFQNILPHTYKYSAIPIDFSSLA